MSDTQTTNGDFPVRPVMTLPQYVAIRKGRLREQSHRLIRESEGEWTCVERSRTEGRKLIVVFG
jgi:hypothetical protein